MIPPGSRKKGEEKTSNFDDSAETAPDLRGGSPASGKERSIILDEAQHLLKLASGVKMIDQLDWLKSMTNTTGALHILTGTYELLPLRNLNGQAARRGLEIHFPRYQFQHETRSTNVPAHAVDLAATDPSQGRDQTAGRSVVVFLRTKYRLYWHLERLARARAGCKVLATGQSELLLECIQECALPIAQCESMALEAAAGEQEVHYTASRQQHLWALLGMKMDQDVIRRACSTHPRRRRATPARRSDSSSAEVSCWRTTACPFLRWGNPKKKGEREEPSFFWDRRGASVNTDASDRSGSYFCARRAEQRDRPRIGENSSSILLTHAADHPTCEQRLPSMDQARDKLGNAFVRKREKCGRFLTGFSGRMRTMKRTFKDEKRRTV